ncbi:Sec3_C domain-containing protein, partial [Haematococcus lacustris]
LYMALVGHMFSVMDRMAAMDGKHGARLRLENYEESLQAYVQQQLEYGKLWQLLEFSLRLSKLLEGSAAALASQAAMVPQVVPPSEVSFQPGCSVAEVRTLLTSTLQEADKKLAVLYSRVRKHLGTTTLSFKVHEQLDTQLVECYGGAIELRPSPDELADMFAR